MRNTTLINELEDALRRLVGKKVRILTHSGGDPDSIGSAYVLSRILEKIGSKEVEIIIPENISTSSRALLKYFGIELSEPGISDIFIVVDAGSPHQLGDMERIFEEGEVLVIDHHATSFKSYEGRGRLFSCEDYQSVCEIIYELAEKIGYRLDAREAEALFLGMYYDTVRFSVADSETMKKACRLVELGVNPSTIFQMFETSMDISERIARLKASKRMKLYKLGKWIIALTHVGSFQSSVARSLLGLGAHIAIVAGEGEDGIHVSFRCVQDLVELGLDLGRIASRISEEFQGHGGGHAAASRSFCRKGSIEEVLMRSLALVSEDLKEEAREVGE